MLQNHRLGKVSKIKGRRHSISTNAGRPINSKKKLLKLPETTNSAVVETWHSSGTLLTLSIIINKTEKAEWQMTPLEKMQLAKDGLNKIDLERLKNKTNLDYDKLSTLLSTARATLINKKGTEQFSASLSEKIVSIADVYSYGFEVFEDETKFNEWVFKPNRALGGKQPFELLDNQFGREEVKNLIGRIEYGVYS